MPAKAEKEGSNKITRAIAIKTEMKLNTPDSTRYWKINPNRDAPTIFRTPIDLDFCSVIAVERLT
jgi:hypothetical protein